MEIKFFVSGRRGMELQFCQALAKAATANTDEVILCLLGGHSTLGCCNVWGTLPWVQCLGGLWGTLHPPKWIAPIL